MNKTEIEKAGKNLQSRFPLLGHTIRMAAVKKLAADLSPDAIPHLVTAISLHDSKVATVAVMAMKSLKDKEIIEFLCEGIINGKLEAAKAIAVEMNYLPAHVSRRCLFLVITGQIEKYLDLDFDFQYLRAEYQGAPDELQQRVRSVIQQSNDHRLMGLFGEVRKKFVAKDLTEHEAELMLEVYARNKQMEEIFALLFFAPLTVVVKALDKLIRLQWQPADEDRKDLFDNLIKVVKTMGEKPKLPPEPDAALGPVFEKWITEGKKEPFISKPENELRTLFNSGAPAEAVAALTALSVKNRLTSADHKAAKNHPHWLVRMAYTTVESHAPELIFANKPMNVEGGNYWLNELPSAILASRFPQMRAVSLNPEALQKLSQALSKPGKEANSLKNWASLLTLLSGFTLRNLISIGKYEKQIEDTAISI